MRRLTVDSVVIRNEASRLVNSHSLLCNDQYELYGWNFDSVLTFEFRTVISAKCFSPALRAQDSATVASICL